MSLGPIAKNRIAGASRPGLIALAVCVVLSILLISVWARDDGTGVLRQAQSAFQAATSPLARIGTIITSPGRAASTAIGDASATDETLSELKAQNEELTAQVAELTEYKEQNEQLSALLGIKELYGFESLTAQVIGSTQDAYNRSLTISLGSDDGVEVGMPVMSGSGLAGQVISTGAHTAVVRCINDYQSGISATLQLSRTTGVLNGGSDGLLHLNYISTSVDVQVGEVVITSGLGGVFPKGIVIGTVVSVVDSATDTEHTITVEPVVSLGVPEVVTVVTGSQTEVTTPTTEELRSVAESGAAAASGSAASDSGDSGDSDDSDASASSAATSSSASTSSATTSSAGTTSTASTLATTTFAPSTTSTASSLDDEDDEDDEDEEDDE